MSPTLSSGVAQAVQVYIKGTKTWIEDPDEAWMAATVISKEESATGIKITLETDAGREHVFESTYTLLEKQKGENLPPLKNPPKTDNIEDLTNLNYLNEPSVLHTIRTRYFERNIYTYSGIVLIAMNPFSRVPLYEPEIIQQYSGKRRGDLEPHLFAIAEDAYRCMVRETSNQTVVVSGESGAGKTVSATHIMRYFATADDAESGKVKDLSKGMTEVEEQIMATNPIMEAFGNAKTTRNNNSSRFGKYIEIQFDKGHNIVGAKIRTYLLERSRLIFQPESERNYHIFYQLCSSPLVKERDELKLLSWDKFHYLNQSGTGTVPGMDDAEEFKLTQNSLSLVGISHQAQAEIYKILAALLHIGNIEVSGRTDAVISDSDSSLLIVTQLLGIKTTEFKKWLIKRQIVTRSDKIIKSLNPTQAMVVRDSVAKYIYANLFDWLVKVVNDSLSCGDGSKVVSFIGVLDIYGFEHFKKNSFEQFCINYANEKLQQQFNQHVFKLEQEEYVREKIDWKFIEFSDNQTCIEVIESKLGILSLLDEESRMPSGTDQGFCNKLFANFTNPKYKDYFKKPRFSNSAFIVCHYAHDVEYDTENFIDKNKDTVPDEILALLQQADSEFLVDMLQTATAAATATSLESKPAPVKKAGMAVAKKPTLGSIFKLSLISLMDTISKTNVHYIRCIKPNEEKVAWGFEPNMVLSQLRACGVLETIHISCAGYPSRWTFQDFSDRFYALAHSKYWNSKTPDEINTICKVILNTHIKENDKYQIGLTKIFFRAGQLAYLEKCRRVRLDECAIAIQKHIKRFIGRKHYLLQLDLISRLQRVARQKMAIKKLEHARQEISAIRIQTHWRRYIQRKRYLQQYRFIIKLQSVIHGHLQRKSFLIKRQLAIQLQVTVRSRLAQRQLKLLAVRAKEYAEASAEARKLADARSRAEAEAKAKADARAKAEADARAEADAKARANIKPMESHHDTSNGYRQDPYKQQDGNTTRQNTIPNLSDYNTKHDSELDSLNRDLARQKEAMARLKSSPGDDVAELKGQIVALKQQLSQSMKNYPKRETSIHGYRSLPSHQFNAQDERRLNARLTFAEPIHLEPKKISYGSDRPQQELLELLQRSDRLEAEVFESLLDALRIVTPDLQKLPLKEEVVYPVHLIGQVVLQLWLTGAIPQAERILARFVGLIQKFCLSFTLEETIVPCSYWLSNTHELLSIVYSVEPTLETKVKSSNQLNWQDYEKHLSTMKVELQVLQENIFRHYLSELNKIVSKLSIPAIIENQSLPGFVENEANRFFNKASEQQTLDDLLNLLNRVYGSLKSYCIKPFVVEQVFNEIASLINVHTFNDLIMRRNFNTWKRAMQIQYNITRLEKWCKVHDATEATNKLEHLIQAAKLLQLKKATGQDITIIYDVCWYLTPTQIQKLTQSYCIAEYEEPITNDVFRIIDNRANHSGSREILLSNEPIVFNQPEPHQAVISSYIPDYLNIPLTQRLISLVDILKRNGN